MRTALTVAILVSSVAVAGAQQRLADQLRKGITQEETAQDLEKAIQTYKAIVAQYDQDRKAAGTALFRLAECYRKAGKREPAVAAYQRVVREFADMASLVEPSRRQLASTYGLSDAAIASLARPESAELQRQYGELRRQYEEQLRKLSETQARKQAQQRDLSVAAEKQRQEYGQQRRVTEEELKATQIETDATSKRLAQMKQRVEVGVVPPEAYHELQAQYEMLMLRYQDQLKAFQAGEEASREGRALNEKLIKSVEDEIALMTRWIDAAEKGVVKADSSELLQRQRELLQLQRKLEELKVGMKR